MKRQRRNAANHRLEEVQAIAVQNVLNGQMVELPNAGNETNSTVCMVLYDGSIKCSPEIYQNPLLWRTSHKNLMAQIKMLQRQIKKLKVSCPREASSY